MPDGAKLFIRIIEKNKARFSFIYSDEDDWDNWFSESEKELQNIFQGQSQMKEILAQLDQKMNDILQRQDRAQQAINVISVSSSPMAFCYMC